MNLLSRVLMRAPNSLVQRAHAGTPPGVADDPQVSGGLGAQVNVKAPRSPGPDGQGHLVYVAETALARLSTAMARKKARFATRRYLL